MYRIYRNLHDKSWTIQHKVPKKGWRKLDGVGAVYSHRVEFKVYEAGRQRARNEGVKNVHAFAITDQFWPIEDEVAGQILDACTYGVKYTPFSHDTGFCTVDGGGRNLESAVACVFTPWGSIGCETYLTRPAQG